jgi:hypothetical protein
VAYKKHPWLGDFWSINNQKTTAMNATHLIHPFSDERAVIGALKASGSQDPDVLYGVMANAATPLKLFTYAGYAFLSCGILLSLTIIGAFVGIPMAIIGWWMQRKMKHQKRMFDRIFNAYCTENGVKLKAA